MPSKITRRRTENNIYMKYIGYSLSFVLAPSIRIHRITKNLISFQSTVLTGFWHSFWDTIWQTQRKITLQLLKKIFYITRTRIKAPNWLKFQPFFLIGKHHWIEKRGNFLTGEKGRGTLKTHNERHTKNTALNVDLFWNIKK